MGIGVVGRVRENHGGEGMEWSVGATLVDSWGTRGRSVNVLYKLTFGFEVSKEVEVVLACCPIVGRGRIQYRAVDSRSQEQSDCIRT